MLAVLGEHTPYQVFIIPVQPDKAPAIMAVNPAGQRVLRLCKAWIIADETAARMKESAYVSENFDYLVIAQMMDDSHRDRDVEAFKTGLL